MSPVRSRFWLIAVLAGGCFGGPISDFPKSTSGETPSAGDPGNNGGESSGDGDGDGDQDSTPPSIDAGVPLGGDGDGVFSPPPPSEASDAGTDAGEGCADEADAGMCQGTLCGTTRSELGAQATPGGACATDTTELNLVCSGAIPRVVADCSQKAFATADLASTEGCAKSDATLGAASPDCIDCYLQESRCMLENCLLSCLAGTQSSECAACRDSHCGQAFRDCSGLPAP